MQFDVKERLFFMCHYQLPTPSPHLDNPHHFRYPFLIKISDIKENSL